MDSVSKECVCKNENRVLTWLMCMFRSEKENVFNQSFNPSLNEEDLIKYKLNLVGDLVLIEEVEGI